jgi:hypothetical protein
MPLALAALWFGCGPRVGRIEPLSIAAPDGQVLEGDVTIAVVGRLADAPEAAAAIHADDPALVVLAGDAVHRSVLDEWAALRASVATLPVSPLPGAGESVGDRKRKGFAAAWDGLGVPGLPGEVTWRSLDVHDGGLRWRLVMVDADRDALGDRWTDQLFWIPKVVGDDGYDHLVVISNQAPATLELEAPEASAGLDELLQLVREHADASRMVLLVAGGGHTPHAILPGGRWGEAWVLTGSPRGPTPALLKADDDQVLATGLADALLAEFERRAGYELDGVKLAQTFEERTAIAGWWTLHFADGALDLQLRLADGETWRTVYTLRFSPSGGWRPVP